MRFISALAISVLAVSLRAACPTGTLYPGAVDTNQSLAVAVNDLSTTLKVSMAPGDNVAIVKDSTGWRAQVMATVDKDPNVEYVWIESVAGNVLTVSRACEAVKGVSPSAKAHPAGAAFVTGPTAYTGHEGLKQAVQAIETALGPNLSNVASGSASLNASAFVFSPYSCNSSGVCAPGGASGFSLVSGNNTLTFAPVPNGINGTDAGHYLYVSGGTGTANACLITGGAGTSGASTGSIILNCANSHSGAWTVGPASGGIQEAICALSGNSGRVSIPATVALNANLSFCGKTAVQLDIFPGVTFTGTGSLPSPNGNNLVSYPGVNSTGSGGWVTVYPPATAGGHGIAVAPDGHHICDANTSSTTSCLQEADNYRVANSLNLIVQPAPYYNLTSTWHIGPMEDQQVIVGATALNCTNAVSGACVWIDTIELGTVEMPGVQIVNGASGPCLLIKPTGTIPDVGFGVGIMGTTIRVHSCNTNGPGIDFDTTNGPIYLNDFEFYESYPASGSAIEVTGSGSPAGFFDNIISATRIGVGTGTAAVVQLGTSSLQPASNEWHLSILNAPPGHPAVDTYAAFDFYDLDVFATSNPSYGIYFESGAKGNRVRPHQLFGSHFTDNGYSIGGTTTGNFLDIPVGGNGPVDTGITLGGSPAIYTNADFQEEIIMIAGGTVSEIDLSHDGITFYGTGLTAGAFTLKPGMALRVIYSVAPTTQRKFL